MSAETDPAGHWAEVWGDRDPSDVSWYQAEPKISLDLIRAAGVEPGDRVVDIGGGASKLVDHLLQDLALQVTVVDIAEASLAAARRRLGPEMAGRVDWVVGDVTEVELPGPYTLWHDRAVFHFLTDPDDRAAYVERLTEALAPGGQVVLGTFALDGPTECSGLPVRRYDAEGLLAELGEEFTLLEERREPHSTPWDTEQSFQWVRAQRDR